MTSNDRQGMYLFRNSTIEDKSSRIEVREYSVTADADIIGEVSYGPFYFTIWELDHLSQPGQERALCLRVSYPLPEVPESYWDAASFSGYYHGGGMADEVVILSSLFLRRRLRVDKVVRLGDSPRMFAERLRSRPIDPEILEGPTNLDTLTTWFELLEKLPSGLHQRFILSAKFYQQALQRADEDPTTAYLHLVSAIEVLSGDFDIGEMALAESDPSLDRLVKRINDEELRRDIEKAIIGNQRFIGRRFKKFILHYIDEDFWREPTSERLRTISQAEIEKLLGRIYRQRSRTLHAGEPFPPSVNYAPHKGEEMPLGLGEMSGDRRWESSGAVPLLHFFERLTRHVLLNYLREKCSESGKQ